MSAAAPVESLLDEADQALLGGLGQRLRDARGRCDLTRRDLALRSQVSERYLAQLEAGHANPSVLVLARLAEALGETLTSLLEEAPAQDIELTLLVQWLQRQPAASLRAIRMRLQKEAVRTGAKRSERIALLGLRGAGKSTLGSRLARALEVPFFELDQEIEREAGTSLADIFLLNGEAGYRRHERNCLERLLQGHERCVIATGGSLVTEPATFELLRSACTCVWLKALPEEHMARVLAQGDTRPMAGNAAAMEDLQRILRQRAPLYALADCVVDTADVDLDTSYTRLLAAATQQP